MFQRGIITRLAPAIALAAVGFAPAVTALADEPLFGFIYTTDLLPKDKMEIEQWVTLKAQKSQGAFEQYDLRSEFSYGVTDNFQLSGYLNFSSVYAWHNGPDGTTTPSEQFSDYNADPDLPFNATRFVGVSVEGIWRLLSPYKDPVGLALYFEPTIGPNFRELEARLILQKNFFDDRLVVAFNFTWAPELRPSLTPPADVETDINWGLGVSYRFAANWSVGWEFQNEREMDGWAFWDRSNWTNSGFYTGPTLHYANERFFATLTAWEQLPWADDYQSNGVVFDGRNYDVDFEKFRVRLKLGVVF